MSPCKSNFFCCWFDIKMEAAYAYSMTVEKLAINGQYGCHHSLSKQRTGLFIFTQSVVFA